MEVRKDEFLRRLRLFDLTSGSEVIDSITIPCGDGVYIGVDALCPEEDETQFPKWPLAVVVYSGDESTRTRCSARNFRLTRKQLALRARKPSQPLDWRYVFTLPSKPPDRSAFPSFDGPLTSEDVPENVREEGIDRWAFVVAAESAAGSYRCEVIGYPNAKAISAVRSDLGDGVVLWRGMADVR